MLLAVVTASPGTIRPCRTENSAKGAIIAIKSNPIPAMIAA
jgi:hypothetical protein